MSTALGFVVGIVVAIIAIVIYRYVRSRPSSVEGVANAAMPAPRKEEEARVAEDFVPPQTQAIPPTATEPPGSQTTTTLPETARIDKNVQFTVYRPATIVPEKWYPLVGFAHLAKRRDDAPKDEPDPIQEVQRQAAKLLSDQPAKYEAAKLDRGFTVPEKGTLTFVPLIEGCEFNPPSQRVQWQRSVHKVEFEMKAAARVDKQDVEGQMTVYLGNVILTEVPLRISVDSSYVASPAQESVLQAASAEPYRKIFASYSHKDTEIVEDFENYVESLGDEYLRDVRTLRSGQKWSEELERMIREASVFQLFWSRNSMVSEYVKQEWEYALKLGRTKFIRPVYWEEPLPKRAPDLPPQALSELHFYKLGSVGEEEKRRGGVVPPFGLGEAHAQGQEGVEIVREDFSHGTTQGTRPPDLDQTVQGRPPQPPVYSAPPPAPAPPPAYAPTKLPMLIGFAVITIALVGLLYLGYRYFRGTPPEPPPEISPTPTPAPTPTIGGQQLPTVSPSPTATPQVSPTVSPTVSPSPSPTRRLFQLKANKKAKRVVSLSAKCIRN